LKLEAIFRVEVQGNICVVCSREVKQWSLGEKKFKKGFLSVLCLQKKLNVKAHERFFAFVFICVQVKKKLRVKAWESKKKIERKLQWKIQKVNCRFNFILVVACVHAWGFIHVCYLWRTWVEFFSYVVCKLVMMAMVGFTMVWQHSSLLTTCFSCFSLFLLLSMVMSHSIITIGCGFIHFYCCSWSSFCSFLLLFNMVVFLFVFAIVHGHALTRLYFCSSLLSLVVVL
jgi:hypothetical protein